MTEQVVLCLTCIGLGPRLSLLCPLDNNFIFFFLLRLFNDKMLIIYGLVFGGKGA